MLLIFRCHSIVFSLFKTLLIYIGKFRLFKEWSSLYCPFKFTNSSDHDYMTAFANTARHVQYIFMYYHKWEIWRKNRSWNCVSSSPFQFSFYTNFYTTCHLCNKTMLRVKRNIINKLQKIINKIKNKLRYFTSGEKFRVILPKENYLIFHFLII